MAIVYTKTDQGLTIATGTGAPVHTAIAGDRYTDTANGNTYQYTTSWQIISYGVIPIPATTYGLFAQTAVSTPVTNATGEASLIGTGVGTVSVPANAFSVGDSFVAKLGGSLTCANNETLHIHIRSNGNIIIDLLPIVLSTSTGKYWDLILDFTIVALGGAGVASMFANGTFTYNKNSNNNIDGIHTGLVSNTLFDTTVINTLTITAEWTTSDPANTIRTQNFTLTKVY